MTRKRGPRRETYPVVVDGVGHRFTTERPYHPHHLEVPRADRLAVVRCPRGGHVAAVVRRPVEGGPTCLVTGSRANLSGVVAHLVDGRWQLVNGVTGESLDYPPAESIRLKCPECDKEFHAPAEFHAFDLPAADVPTTVAHTAQVVGRAASH